MPSRLHRQDGYSMVVVMIVMLVGTLVSIGAWRTATGDLRPGHLSLNDKRALAAAQSAVSDYQQKLGSDNEYWLKCTNLPAQANGSPAAVNQKWSGTGTDPRVWRSFDGGPNISYTTELIPRTGYTGCQENVDASMLSASGTIQIRTTGRAGRVGSKDVRKRSLVTTLRRNGFLDFLYFTEYETRDPLQREIDVSGQPTKPCGATATCALQPLSDWADQTSTCRRYVRDGRDTAYYQGSVQWFDNKWYDLSALGYANSRIYCGNIVWKDGESNAGPFHTNDTVSLCNQPLFGRNRSGALSEPIDRVEYWSYTQTCNGAGPDNGNNTVATGTTNPQMPILKLPESNGELLRIAQQNGIVYTGRTTLVLNGNTMTVTTSNGTTTNNVAFPTNGVIYVQNGTGCPAFRASYPYQSDPTTEATAQANCGDVIVRGTYSKGLTIATARDVQIAGDLTYTNNALLGLIANNFVRVRHPVASYPCDSSTDEGTNEGNRTIQAAILSLGHVFTVDNYQCGDPLGDLTVFGAIAQRYRGPVGTFNSSSGAVSGYTKKYKYDDRLRYRSPPYFLAPVQSAWRIVRSTEQVPAT